MIGRVEHYVSSRHRRQRTRLLRSLILAVVTSALIYVTATGFLGMTLVVASAEMQPGLVAGDRLLALRTGARRVGGSVERGDVVFVRPPEYPPNGVLTAVIEPLLRFFTLNWVSIIRFSDGSLISPAVVRRVVAVPGDAVELRDFVAFVTVPGGSPSSEHQLLVAHALHLPDEHPAGWDERGLPFGGAAASVTLAHGEFFVLCDDRACAADSRVWGPVAEERLIGKVVFRFWPLRRS